MREKTYHRIGLNMDLVSQIKKAYVPRARSYKRKTAYTTKCKVIGCRELKKHSRGYCSTHEIGFKSGSLINDVPCFIKTKAKLTYQYFQDLNKDITSGEVKAEEVATKALQDMLQMWSFVQGPVNYISAEELVDPNLSGIEKRKAEIRARRHTDRKVISLLKLTPIEMQIAEFAAADDFVKVTLMSKIDHINPDTKEPGYCDSKGLFLKPEEVKQYLNRAFDRGDILKVYTTSPLTEKTSDQEKDSEE